MQTSELKITKTPLKEELVSSAKSESTTKPSLNAQATDVFLQKISAERPYVSENLQRSLNSLHASLSEKLKNPAQDSNTPRNAGANAPLARLSTKLIERDPTLQEKTARALSTASQPVSSRQAVTTLKQSLAVLPASLQEGNETGDALGRTLTGTLSDLSDHSSMGAGLIRDLAVRGIYVTQDSLPLKNRAAAERMLNNTISFIRSNSPEVLNTLAPNKALNSASSNTPTLRAEHNTEVTTDEDLRDNTYLDIFKKKDPISAQRNTNTLGTPDVTSKANNQVADELKSSSPTNNSEDVTSDNTQNSNLKNFAEPSERIRQIIEKAADTVRRGNLMRSDDMTSRKETTSLDENQHTPLRDLVSRASMLERQFREERQRLNTDENATSNTQSQNQKTEIANKDDHSQALQSKALNTSSNTFKDLNKAQFSFSYSAIQNSFYGGIASVPGMDLPVEDFNSSEVKDFIANSQAAELSSKKILNTVLRERRELLQGSKNVGESAQTPVTKDTEASLKTNEVDNKVSLNKDAGDAQINTSQSSDLKKNIQAQSQDLSDESTKDPKPQDLKSAQDVNKLEKTSAEDIADEEITNKSLPEDKVENKVEDSPQENIKQELENGDDEVTSSKIADSTSQNNESKVSHETSNTPVATPSQTQITLEDGNKDENADVLEQKNAQQNNVSKAPLQTEDFANEQYSDLEKNVLSKQAVESVKAFEKANATELVAENADANKSATGKKNEGILNFLTPTAKKDENITPNITEQNTAEQNTAEDVALEENNTETTTNLTQTSTQNSTQNTQNFVNTAENQVLPSAASIVTSGGNEPLPQKTMPEFSAVTKEDGLFKRIASLFSRSEQTTNSTNELNSQMIAEVAVKVPLLKNTPFDVFMQSLSVASGNLKLPESVRKEAQKLKEQLANPLVDLKAVDSWLSFVTGPMSPSSTQAIALQQWAFLLLCLRFKQIGKNISSFLKKNDLKGLDRELEDMLLPFPDCKDDIAELSTQALDQIASAQQKQSDGNPVLNDRYLPLPPSYEGGREGGMILRSTRNEKGQKVWHMTFQFDLEKIGAVEIKAVACLPEVRLSFAAETLEGLRSMQNNCGHLAESLEKIGLQAKTSAPRLGRISPLSGARESKPLAPSPATGISLEI